MGNDKASELHEGLATTDFNSHLKALPGILELALRE